MYKCLQVTPDRTVNNKRGSDFARAMHEYMYLPLHIRVNLSERKLDALNAIWWVIILKRSGITFNLAVDESQETFAKQRLAHYWERASVVESELHPCQIENTSISQLKYSRHNIFALSADWREDTVPMSSILQVVHDMHDEDEARLYIGLQPYSRTAWSDWATAAHESFRTGKTPQRRSAQAYTGWKQGIKILDSAMSEVMSAVDVLFSSNTEAKMMDAKRRQKPDYDKREIMMDGKLSRETLAKRNEPVFRAFIYATSHSVDPARRQITLSGLCNAFTELSGDNELVQVKLSTACLQRVNNLKIPHSFDVCLMSCSEVGKLIQLPTASLQDEYSEHMNTIEKREVDVPDRLLNDKGIYIGDVTFRGKAHPVYFPVSNKDELCLPHIVIGSMGQGKTSFGSHLVTEHMKQGFSCFAIDVAKDEIYQDVSAWSKQNGYENKVIHVRFGNKPIGLDWCEISQSPQATNRFASEILAIFERRGADAGLETKRYIRLAAKTVASIGSNKLSEIVKLFTDDDYLKRAIVQLQKVKRDDLVNDWNVFMKLSPGMKGKVLEPVLNRLDILLGDDYLASCIRSGNGLDMRKWINDGYGVILHVPIDELGDEATDTICSILIAKIWLATLWRKNNTKEIPCGFVMDEPHSFMSSAEHWKSMVVTSRKYRLKLIWMFHTWEQIPKDLAEIIKSAGPHYSLYPSSKKTFKDLSEEIKPYELEDAIKIPTHHAINIIRSGGTAITPFLAKMAHVKVRETSEKETQTT